MICPVCLTQNTRRLTGDELNAVLFLCDRCTCIFDARCASESNSAKQLERQMVATDDYYGGISDPTVFEDRMKSARSILQEVLPLVHDKDVFLEMGTGDGFLARAASESFSEVIALDITLDAANRMNAIFPPPVHLTFLHHDDFVNRPEKPLISVIAAWHVLEHLPNPEEILGPLIKVLGEKGVFYGQVPMMRPAYVFPEHFIFYNEIAITFLFYRLKLEPIWLRRDEKNHFLSFVMRNVN